METGATHAELMLVAARHLRIAQTQLASDAIVSREDALAAATTFKELVHALGSHARVLAGPRDRVRAVLNSPRPDPVVLTTVRFSKALSDAVPGRPQQPELLSAGSLAAHYKNSAIAVRAATDLVLTHRQPGAPWRAPESELLMDPRAQVMILDDVAQLAVDLANGRQTLHEQIQQLDRHRQTGTGRLPELAAVRDTARDVHDVAQILHRRDAQLARVSELGVGPTVGGPVARMPTLDQELLERVRRLHAHAWLTGTKSETPQISTQALADMAAVGVGVNTQAAVFAARIAGTEVRAPEGPGVVKEYLAKAAGWRGARDQLLTLQTTALHDQAVTNETRAIAQVLRQMSAVEPGPGVEARLHSYAALRSASGLLDQVADWNAASVARLARAGAIYQPGRLLTGAQVTDDPDLVTAKLSNKLVTAPAEQSQTLVLHYGTARSATAQVTAQQAAQSAGPRPPAI